MTDEFTEEAERALGSHGAFEPRDDGDGFAVRTSPFDAVVRVRGAGSTVEYAVRVRAPTLNAVVEGEEVAPVVREGWFETLERRMEDVGGVTRADPEEPLVSLDAEAEEVVVETAFESDLPARGADDAKAVVDYVEGTYLEGVIPGYEYGEPVSEMMGRARERSQG